uniref:Chromosome transmission fidelity protein 8 n=1 Tax=Lygus hesperus TaxID=30085 RepID=A0A0A9X8Q1_LYGHE
MTIIVKLEDEGAESWGIIELQGDLESREGGTLQSKFVGDLHYTVQGGIPTLIIGHHILYGKSVTMEKPFAVLEKQHYCTDQGLKRTKYVVKACVKKKLIFKVRPKPIIANVAQ